jgi:hypothetical protein
MLDELSFSCPNCWQEQTLFLDPEQSSTFVQDCEVCCSPIEFTPERDDEGNVVDVIVNAE